MFHSVHHAVAAMLRYQERQRSPRSAPWPDRAPQAVSVADRWRYVYVHGTRPPPGPEPDNERDVLTVLVLFDRHDRYRYLTRLLVKREGFDSFSSGRERGRAWRTLVRFAGSLCCLGLLESPQKWCPQNLQSKFPACMDGCRAEQKITLDIT